MSESQQQAAVIDRFLLQYPEYKIHSIPNGTHIKSYQGRIKAKREGLLKGVCDLFIPVPRGQYHGFYLEMKDVGKTASSLTADQKAFIEYATWQGYKADWAAGYEQAWEKIEAYMNLKKAL
jgi:hypothetical protein